MRKVLYLVITLLSIVTVSACGKKESLIEESLSNNSDSLVESETVDLDKLYPLIDKLITDKSYAKEAAVEADIEKIAELSKEEGEKWQAINRFWNDINEDDYLHIGEIPEGLPEDGTLCIAILGYCLNSDGSMRDELMGRLDTAIEIANKYPESYILVTGGPTASSNANATEADSMAQYLADQGIDSKRIIIENKSLTSAENAIFSYNILASQYEGVDSIVMVTSDYHVGLGALLFETQFIINNSKMHVISNYAYLSGNSYYFSIKSQADWLRSLYRENLTW